MVTRLSGGLTPGDGSDPRTFPAIWNVTADTIESQGTAITGAESDIDDLEAKNIPAFGTATPSDGQVLTYDSAGSEYVPEDVSLALNDLTDAVITSPSSGEVLEYDGTNWVNAAGGKILQVVQSDETSSLDITSSTYTDISGASVTITPQSSSSKVLVSFHIMRNAPRGNGRFISYRLTATSGADTGELARYYDASGNNEIEVTINATKLMSPATTSPVTFQLQGKESSGLTFRTSNIYLIAMEVGA